MESQIEQQKSAILFVSKGAQTTMVATLRAIFVAGIASVVLSACAINQSKPSATDYSNLSQMDAQSNLAQLAARFEANRRDKYAAINFAAALRSAGQAKQAVSVLEITLSTFKDDPDVDIAYAKALTADGRFEQALNVINNTIRPENPNWNALSVKGAILDQMGQNTQARALYNQAMVLAPNEASLEANLGLSYAMTSELEQAEIHLKRALTKSGATSRIRQNLALVIGLQGRFDEARAIYSAELPPDQVETNMAYIRGLLTQQNRWDSIQEAG
ncbi:MAG: tetratricopeptide repeat protein [Devosiaceae bacterium]|nr:tetratricopeptide repeat protein [Devosiaceae bacterium]